MFSLLVQCLLDNPWLYWSKLMKCIKSLPMTTARKTWALRIYFTIHADMYGLRSLYHNDIKVRSIRYFRLTMLQFTSAWILTWLMYKMAEVPVNSDIQYYVNSECLRATGSSKQMSSKWCWLWCLCYSWFKNSEALLIWSLPIQKPTLETI